MIKRCWRDHASQGQHDSTNATACILQQAIYYFSDNFSKMLLKSPTVQTQLTAATVDTPVSGPTSNTCICCYKGEEFATEIQTIFIPSCCKHFKIPEKVGHVSMRVYRDCLTYGASFKCLLDKLQFLALTLCLFFSLFVFSGSLNRPGLVLVLFIADTRTGLASTHWPSPGARGGVSKGPHEKLWAEFSSASYYFWCEPPQRFDLLPRMKMIWEPQCRHEYDGVCITGSGRSASQLGNCSLVSH